MTTVTLLDADSQPCGTLPAPRKIMLQLSREERCRVGNVVRLTEDFGQLRYIDAPIVRVYAHWSDSTVGRSGYYCAVAVPADWHTYARDEDAE